jgi:hypothetical protein
VTLSFKRLTVLNVGENVDELELPHMPVRLLNAANTLEKIWLVFL